jgi:hypothetical protein
MDAFLTDYKFWLMSIGIILSAQNYIYYYKKTLAGEFKPHMFSWGIWALLGAIAFCAQYSEDAGFGMWQNAFMTLGLTTITILAYFMGNKNYMRSDWICLLFALMAIPLWVVTKNPLWSVILITIIDVVATVPTITKSWKNPHQESSRTFAMAGLICALSIISLDVFNMITTFYMGVITILNFLLALMIMFRRNKIKIMPA